MGWLGGLLYKLFAQRPAPRRRKAGQQARSSGQRAELLAIELPGALT